MFFNFPFILTQLQQAPPTQTILTSWTVFVTVVFGIIVTVILSYIITSHLRRNESINEDRFKRIEANIEKICRLVDEIKANQNEFHSHVLLQKEKNQFYAGNIDRNREDLSEIKKETLTVLSSISQTLLKLAM